MRRKLIKQGVNSYTLTLPISWVDGNKLKGGDEIEVRDNGSALEVIASPGKEQKTELTLGVKDLNPTQIVRSLQHAYRKGADIVNVECTKEQEEFILGLVGKALLGFEFVERRGSRLVIENITEPSEDKFEVLLRRVFLLIKEEGNVLRECIAQAKTDSAKRQEMGRYIDSLSNFLRRVQNKGIRDADSPLRYHVISLLTLVQHAYYHAHEAYFAKGITSPSKEMLALVGQINESFALLYEGFYSKKIGTMHEARKLCDQTRTAIEQKIQLAKGKEALLLLLLSNISRSVAVACSAMLGLGVQPAEQAS